MTDKFRPDKADAESVALYGLRLDPAEAVSGVEAAPTVRELIVGLLEELRLIRMKDCGAVYDPTIRKRAEIWLASSAPAPVPAKPNWQWSAEDYRRSADVHETAERIIKRVVTNVLNLAHVRHNLDELVEAQALVDDGIAVASGEDTGCLDPDDLSAENCEVLYVEQELREILERKLAAPSATRARELAIQIMEFFAGRKLDVPHDITVNAIATLIGAAFEQSPAAPAGKEK